MTAALAASDATPWWQILYDDWLAEVFFASSSNEDIEATLDYLVAKLRLSPGDRVLDQCCGTGRLAVPLAARGFEVLGVDQAAGYIARGRRAASARGVTVDLCAADAAEHRPEAPVAGVFNWWTSFGYAARDDENLRMLRAAFEALRPGGGFLLDTMHAPSVLRGFLPEVREVVEAPQGPVELVRHSRVEWSTGTLVKRWAYTLPDGRAVERHSRVRLYMPHELGALLSAAGFEAIGFDGAIDGRPLALDSPRCIVHARRLR